MSRLGGRVGPEWLMSRCTCSRIQMNGGGEELVLAPQRKPPGSGLISPLNWLSKSKGRRFFARFSHRVPFLFFWKLQSSTDSRATMATWHFLSDACHLRSAINNGHPIYHTVVGGHLLGSERVKCHLKRTRIPGKASRDLCFCQKEMKHRSAWIII